MAVSVDKVYQKVLAMANKEQRGYITPQEFNLYADQAQTDIFERYFHDIRQAETRMETDTEFSSSLDMLEEKLSIFRAYDETIYPINYYGHVTLPTNVYRLGKIYYCFSETRYIPDLNSKIELEEIKRKDIDVIARSKYCKPTNRRPAYVRLNDTTIQVYPHAVSNTDIQYFKYGPAQYYSALGVVTLTQSSTQATFDDTTQAGRLFSNGNAFVGLPKIIGNGIPTDTFVESPFPNTNTNASFTLSKAATISGTVSVTIASGDTKCDYIRKPTTPNWSYTEINGAAMHNPGTSVDFELHKSEESMLVSKIIQLSGMTLKDNNLLQIGNNEEIKTLSTQKQ